MSRSYHYVAVALVLGLCACGGGGTPSSSAVPSTLPAPAPIPTPTPNPWAAACGTPLPPYADSYGFGIKVQLEPTRNKKVLNASPIIRNAEYCAAAGFPPNTLICNTRKEDHPQRIACDHYLSGMSDQGRPGPNWFQDLNRNASNERLVKCNDPNTTCGLKPEDQYLLDISDVGRYVACGGQGSPGTCGDCEIVTMERSTGSLGGLCKHQ